MIIPFLIIVGIILCAVIILREPKPCLCDLCGKPVSGPSKLDELGWCRRCGLPSEADS